MPLATRTYPGWGEQQFRRKDALDQQAAPGPYRSARARPSSSRDRCTSPVSSSSQSAAETTIGKRVQDPGARLHRRGQQHHQCREGSRPGRRPRCRVMPVVVDQVRAPPCAGRSSPNPAAVCDGVGQLTPGPGRNLALRVRRTRRSRFPGPFTQIEEVLPAAPCGSIPGQQPIDVVAVAGRGGPAIGKRHLLQHGYGNAPQVENARRARCR